MAAESLKTQGLRVRAFIAHSCNPLCIRWYGIKSSVQQTHCKFQQDAVNELISNYVRSYVFSIQFHQSASKIFPNNALVKKILSTEHFKSPRFISDILE